MTRPVDPNSPLQRYVTVERLAEVDERARRHSTLIRQLQGRTGGATYPPDPEPDQVLGWVGPGDDDVAWVDPLSGEQWFSGPGAPDPATGNIGDWYLDSDSGEFYEKTADDEWTLTGNLTGPTGADGAEGPEGPEGPPGPPGPGVPPGGTTGQVLTKDSDTDLDTIWSDASGGGGVEEVWVGPEQPVGAEELWLDTDAPASVAVACSLVVGSGPPSLVTNGDFETDVSGWLTSGGFWLNSGATITRVPGDFRTGAACAEIAYNGSLVYQGARTEFAVVAGRTYTATVWLKLISGSGLIRIGIGNGTVGYAITNIAALPTAWTRYTVTFTPTATGIADLVVQSQTAAAAAFRVDTAVVEQAAAPFSDGVVYLDTPAGAMYGPKAGVWPTTVIGPALVAALPSSPSNGQEVYYQTTAMRALGVVWRLRYRAFSIDGVTPNPATYKWEFVGGGAWMHELPTETTVNANSGWLDNAGSIGPLIVVPLSGDYEVIARCEMYTRGVQGMQYMGVAKGATDPGNAVTIVYSHGYPLGAQAVVQAVIPAVGAGIDLRMRYSGGQGAGQSTSAIYRSLSVRPIRVG